MALTTAAVDRQLKQKKIVFDSDFCHSSTHTQSSSLRNQLGVQIARARERPRSFVALFCTSFKYSNSISHKLNSRLCRWTSKHGFFCQNLNPGIAGV